MVWRRCNDGDAMGRCKVDGLSTQKRKKGPRRDGRSRKCLGFAGGAKKRCELGQASLGLGGGGVEEEEEIWWRLLEAKSQSGLGWGLVGGAQGGQGGVAALLVGELAVQQALETG